MGKDSASNNEPRARTTGTRSRFEPSPRPHSSSDTHTCGGVNMARKVLMREWLRNHIEDATVRGLDWVDRSEGVFRIPWKHGSLRGWSVHDVDIFKKWAIHTDKFDPRKEDTKRWKANFRCALNSLPDLERVTNVHAYDTKGKNAYRLFRFLPEKKRAKRCANTAKKYFRTEFECKCPGMRSNDKELRDYSRTSVADTCVTATPTESSSYSDIKRRLSDASSMNGFADTLTPNFQQVSHEEEVETMAIDDPVDDNLTDHDVVDLIDRMSNGSSSPQPTFAELNNVPDGAMYFEMAPRTSVVQASIPTPTYFQRPGDYSQKIEDIVRAIKPAEPTFTGAVTIVNNSYHELQRAQVPETVKALETAGF